LSDPAQADPAAPPAGIGAATEDLRRRIAACVPDAAVALAGAADPPDAPLLLRLVRVEPEVPPGEARRPLALRLHYLLEAAPATLPAAQTALGEAAFALMAEPGLEVSAVGIPAPQGPLAIGIGYRLQRARPPRALRRVEKPLVLEAAPWTPPEAAHPVAEE
jgi:hypothetical protein